MKRQLTLGEYRALDIGLFFVLMAVSEILIFYASSFWFPDQLYVVSPVAAVTAVVMMRWGLWSGIIAAAGGFVHTFLAGGGWQQMLIYIVGNLASLLAYLMLHFRGKEKVRTSVLASLLFGILVQFGMHLGRAAVAAALGNELSACLYHFTADGLSYVFTFFIVWIVRRLDGLFEDQKHYLLRIQSERQVEGRD